MTRASPRGLDAANLEATVTSLMHRLKMRGEVERVPDGWVRVTPGMYVANRASGARPAHPNRAPLEPGADRQEGSLAWRVESLLRAHGEPVAARVVADSTGEPVNVVGLTLGRLVKQQRVEQRTDGRFTLVVTPPEASGPESTPEAAPPQPPPDPGPSH